MDKLNFYTADFDYVKYLQEAEKECRGFSRVPNMEYTNGHKQKFLCGIVLRVNEIDYYVPVTSYKQQKPDNFLIKADNGQVVSSLRFNYMFPIPKELTTVHVISDEPDRAYRALLAQELRYCIKNHNIIHHLAERTYKRVLLGKSMGLVVNSRNFRLLEEKYRDYLARNFSFRAMNQQEAEEIADDWKYDGVYSFYDISADAEDYSEFVNEEKRADKYFSCYLYDKLVAWYSLDVLENNNIELGLGIKPNCTGKGFGFHFVSAVMIHAASIHCVHSFVLSVASFNKRAIKAYKKAGFVKTEIFMQDTNGGSYEFLKMMRNINNK